MTTSIEDDAYAAVDPSCATVNAFHQGVRDELGATGLAGADLNRAVRDRLTPFLIDHVKACQQCSAHRARTLEADTPRRRPRSRHSLKNRGATRIVVTSFVVGLAAVFIWFTLNLFVGGGNVPAPTHETRPVAQIAPPPSGSADDFTVSTSDELVSQRDVEHPYLLPTSLAVLVVAYLVTYCRLRRRPGQG